MHNIDWRYEEGLCEGNADYTDPELQDNNNLSLNL